MIYPIVAYGDPVLRKKAVDVEQGSDVRQLGQDMLTTMDKAQGIGLAAPQIGKSLRLFVVDLNNFFKEDNDPVHRKILINPVLNIDDKVATSTYEEGCLSIPGILVNVPRKESITVRYFDTEWQLHEEQWTGFPARVIMHEYDHLEGTLHVDYAAQVRKHMLKGKLAAISRGQVTPSYKMRFPG